MKKTSLYAIIIATILIFCSFTTLAKKDNAPGQRRKNYSNSREFVLSVISNIFERLQIRGVNPPGLIRLMQRLSLGNGDVDEEEIEFEADANGDYEGIVNESLQFEGRAENGTEPYSWFWDLGDGNSSSEQNPIHIYGSAGNFTVNLTVTDNVSDTASDSAFVIIKTE